MKDRDLLFGTLAIKKGYVTTDQIAACIRDQAQHLQEGKTLRLGQVMVRNNILTAGQFMELLEEQEQQILECPTCGKRYNVKHHESGKKVRCRGCKGVLIVPTDVDAMLQSELIEIGSSVVDLPREPVRPPSTIGRLSEQHDVPERFGRYEVSAELGRGGMGVVYRARDPRSGEEVALKVMRPGIERQEEVAARFQREIGALRKLDHPAIVRIHEVGLHEGRAYYSMEFIDGVDLDARFQAGAPRGELLDLLLQVAEGLGCVHARRIVHRDIKPANILIDKQGRPHLTDFGLARDLDAATVLTRPGEIVGTPHYMAPEQILGDERTIGPTCDVYALGILLYQVLTGELPHAGNSVIELYSQVLEQAPRPPRELAPDLDPAIEQVVLTAIEKEPSKRYASAAELAGALRAALARPEPAPSPAAPRTRVRAVAAATALLLFAGGLFLGWLLGRRSKSAAAYLQAAESSLASGAYRESLGYFERAVALADSPAARDGRARARLALAALETRDAARAGQVDRALDRLEACAKLLAEGRAGSFAETLPLLARLELESAGAGLPVTLHPASSDGGQVAARGLPAGATPLVVRLPRGRYEVRVGAGPAAVRFPLALERDARWRIGRPPADPGLRLVPAGPDDASKLTPFLIGARPVTLGQYRRFLAALPAEQARRRAPAAGAGDLPVRGVSWHDAQAYAAWGGMRLPSRLEWRRALGEPGRSPYGALRVARLREWRGRPDRDGMAPAGERVRADRRLSDVGFRVARSVLDERAAADPRALAELAGHRFFGVQLEALRLLAARHTGSLETVRVLLALLDRPAPLAGEARRVLYALDPRRVAAGLVALAAAGDAPAEQLHQRLAGPLGPAGAYALLTLLLGEPARGQAALVLLLDRTGDRAAQRIEQALALATPAARTEIQRALQIHQVRWFQEARRLAAREDAAAKRAEILRLLGRSLALDPTLKEAYWLRGKLRRRGKPADLDGALADFAALLAIDPRFLPARFERALIHEFRDEYALALAEVQQIERHRKDDPEMLLLTGRLQYKLHRYREAAAALDRAVPRLPEELRAGAQDYLARAWSHTGRHAEAIALARKLPAGTRSRLTLGEVLTRAGKQEEAKTVYRALLADPALPPALREAVRRRLQALGK